MARNVCPRGVRDFPGLTSMEKGLASWAKGQANDIESSLVTEPHYFFLLVVDGGA